MAMRKLPDQLRTNRRGSVAVEFALLAPMLITLILGMFQIGIGMQNYNALRGAADEAARNAVIRFQDGTRPTEQTLITQTRTIATSLPYKLGGNRLTVNVDILDTSRVAGALEATITMRYNVPSVLSTMGMNDITINYTRSVFLIS